jgi:hypothetical protein
MISVNNSSLLPALPFKLRPASEDEDGKDPAEEPTDKGVPGPYEEEDAEELDELDVTWDEVDEEDAERGPWPWPTGPVYAGMCTRWRCCR